MPASYYEQLKAQLEADAAAKKAALDAAYERATGAQFDTSGNLTYKTSASGMPEYGTLDVAYQEGQRNLGAGAEASGMLNSGQYARNLATSQAAYRSQILGLKSTTAEQKAQIDTGTAADLAKYGAMYNTGGTTPSGTTPPGAKPATAPTTPTGAKPITVVPPPTFSPGKPVAPKETLKTPKPKIKPVPHPAGSASRGGF